MKEMYELTDWNPFEISADEVFPSRKALDEFYRLTLINVRSALAKGDNERAERILCYAIMVLGLTK